MNRSRIEWTDHTINIITGCRHECEYCYARRLTKRFAGDVRLNLMAKADYRTQPARDGGKEVYVLDKPMLNENGEKIYYPFDFEPTLHLYRMDSLDNLKSGFRVFVGAMTDMWGEWVPNDWIDKVFEACFQHPLNNYLFLTKNPKRYKEYGVPTGHDNFWYGTTITREKDDDRLWQLPDNCKTFVSIEPILEEIKIILNEGIWEKLDWIIIGAETGKRKGKVVPAPLWIERIVKFADEKGIPVFMKDSLIPIVGEDNMRRDFPPELTIKRRSPKLENRESAMCAGCRSMFRIKDMITLAAKGKRLENVRTYGHMCKECFKKHCNQYGLELPDVGGLRNE